MAEVGLGTLYDMNKAIIEQQGRMSKTAFKDKLNGLVTDFFKATDNTYYMMLCNEQRDYTVFRISEFEVISKAVQELKECIENRGAVMSIEKDKNGAIEIWIKDMSDEQNYCYIVMISVTTSCATLCSP